MPNDQTGAAGRAPLLRVRWLVFAGVFVAAFAAYLERRAVNAAGAQMMPELGFTKTQLGYLFNAFLLPYALLQYPGGLLAQRFGTQRTTLVCLLLSTLGTALTAFVPTLLAGGALLLALCAAQAVVGLGQAPLFPSNAGVIHAWFPPRRWSLMIGLQVTGLSLGAAAAPPAIAALMTTHGWRTALYATCVPTLLLAAWWAWYVRETPRQHRAVTAAELAEIEPEPRAPVPARVGWAEIAHVLGNRNVLLLTLGYLAMNYVFYFFNQWSFLYLIEERHLTLLTGGLLASIPLLVGACCATLGGVVSDAACARFGPRRGFRILPLVALPLSALLLLVAAHATEPAAVVAALAGCFGCVQMTESAFWGATFWVARERASAATGVLNMGGNLGGIVGTVIVAHLADAHDWPGALAVGVGFALASAALWLVIDVGRRPEALA
ncbi:MAG: MFS transporter [Proteobacteria bacterium]|nr:MFS transporter [Pseudomonadota bacterium]